MHRDDLDFFKGASYGITTDEEITGEYLFSAYSKLRQNIVVLLKKPLYFWQKVLIRQLLQKSVVPGCYKELWRKLR